jgi:hypothetical protein
MLVGSRPRKNDASIASGPRSAPKVTTPSTMCVESKI